MIENVWKWEMQLCCSMQLEALYKKLTASPDIMSENESIWSGICSAPRNELLFDAVNFFLRKADGNRLEIYGIVHYLHPVKGPWNSSAVLRVFDTLQECLEWLKDPEMKNSQECAEIFYSVR